MKKFSRCLALVGLAAVSVGAVGALTSCGNDIEYEYDEETGEIIESTVGDGDTELKLWCPSNAIETTSQLVSDFCKEYNNFRKDYHVRIIAQGEGDAATNVITDVTSSADVFFFAQDQLARLVQVGALSKVSSTYVDDVTARNDVGSVAAGTSGDTLYAYPLTSDNGYFAFYDKSVPGLQEEFEREGGPRQEELIRICDENNKLISFELDNSGWYLASYFFATGCVSEWTTDDDGTFVSRVDTWNSDAGLIAAQGAYELMSSRIYSGSSDAAGQFNSNAAIVVSGTWDTSAVQNILGPNMGVSELWSFTVDGGETYYHLSGFSGYKLVGVRQNADGNLNVWSHTLANYITDYAGQMLRFNELGWGPSNLKAQAEPEVQADEVLSALNAQNAYAIPQGQFPNDWWDVTVTLGASIRGSGGTEDGLWACLETYDASLDSILAPYEAEYILLCGGMNNWDNSSAGNAETEFLYTITGAGSVNWTVEVTFSDCSTDACYFRFIFPDTWSYTVAGGSALTSAPEGFTAATEGYDNIIYSGVAGTYGITLTCTLGGDLLTEVSNASVVITAHSA
ncbi:MAG: extracellular solute-binding protein [Coprobacillus sp.]|nr:extracellular solute-binding protein [Coprobacillus sp.]